jgi:hypothetical protein
MAGAYQGPGSSRCPTKLVHLVELANPKSQPDRNRVYTWALSRQLWHSSITVVISSVKCYQMQINYGSLDCKRPEDGCVSGWRIHDPKQPDDKSDEQPDR